MRVVDTMLPQSVNPPANIMATWGALSPYPWNSKATKAAPSVCPVSRAVDCMPLAPPLR